jgi:hypothetical protein
VKFLSYESFCSNMQLVRIESRAVQLLYHKAHTPYAISFYFRPLFSSKRQKKKEKRSVSSQHLSPGKKEETHAHSLVNSWILSLFCGGSIGILLLLFPLLHIILNLPHNRIVRLNPHGQERRFQLLQTHCRRVMLYRIMAALLSLSMASLI